MIASKLLTANPLQYSSGRSCAVSCYPLAVVVFVCCPCSQIMGRGESEDLSAAQIMYPVMQCADIFFLKVSSSRQYKTVPVHCSALHGSTL